MPAFDPHDHRASLKLRRQEDDLSLFENRDGVSCPVCDRSFARVLASERRGLRLAPDGELCVLRGADRLFLFSH